MTQVLGHDGEHPPTSGRFTVQTVDKILKFVRRYGRQTVLAAKVGGITPSCLLGWINDIPAFKDAFEEACQEFNERLEREAVRRAVKGWDEPVFQKGELVGHKRVYSERLLEILLRANMPEKYRERGAADGSVVGGVLVIGDQMTAEQAARALEDLTTVQEQLRKDQGERVKVPRDPSETPGA